MPRVGGYYFGKFMTKLEQLKEEVSNRKKELKEKIKELALLEAEEEKGQFESTLNTLWVESEGSYYVPVNWVAQTGRLSVIEISSNHDNYIQVEYYENYLTLRDLKAKATPYKGKGEEFILSLFNRYFQEMFKKKLIVGD